jgi:hypothetical protein
MLLLYFIQFLSREKTASYILAYFLIKLSKFDDILYNYLS